MGAEPPRGLVVLGGAAFVALAALLEIAVRGHIGWLVGSCFIVACVGAALTVRVRDLFVAGVLPPLLMLSLLVGVTLVHQSGIGVRALEPEAGALQIIIAGFVDEAGALVVAHMLTLVVVGLRVRLERRRPRPIRPMA